MWTVHRSPKLGSIPRYSKDSQVFGPESKGRDTSLQSRCSRAVYDSSTGEIWKTSSAEFGLYAEAEKYLKVCLDLAEWNGFNMVARVLEVAEILLFLETPSSFLCFFLRMLRSSGSETLAPGRVVTCHWGRFPVMPVCDCPTKGQGKSVNHSCRYWMAEKPDTWERRAISVREIHYVFCRERVFFSPLP